MPRPVVIDCDPGIDDAVALLVAIASPEISLVGVTTVAGNVGLDATTGNALGVLALAGRGDIPVAAGASRPLVRAKERHAEDVHGANGFGGVELPAGRPPHELPAPEFLAAVVRESAEPVTLVAVGPLTNVALFYAAYPELAARLDRLVVMGGAVNGGNQSPAAEFNVWFDPEAAYRVLTEPGLPKPVPTTLIGLDVTHQTLVTVDRLEAMRASGPVGATVAEAARTSLRHYTTELGRPAVPVHDAVAVAEAVQPGLIRAEYRYLEVDTGYGPSRGSTLVDLRDRLGRRPNVHVGLGADVTAVVDLITDRVCSYGGR